MRNVSVDKTDLFKYIEIETINRCNGDCAFCPVNINQPQRTFAKMEERLFKKIINELGEISYEGEIHLFSNNEPFLDERICKFAKYARLTVPKAYISIYTNGTLLTLDVVREIVNYVDILVIDDYKPNDSLSKIDSIEKWCEEKNDGYEKVCIDRRNYAEVLSSRGGNSPNKKKVSQFGVIAYISYFINFPF